MPDGIVVGHTTVPHAGLTIREEFAMAAMWSPRNPHNAFDHEAAANWACIEADMLIAELAKKKP
jgi:hypothetical protein